MALPMLFKQILDGKHVKLELELVSFSVDGLEQGCCTKSFAAFAKGILMDGQWRMGSGTCDVNATLAPAPGAIILLVKCRCSKQRCSSNRCQYRMAGLLCTDLCGCSDGGECENKQDDDFYAANEDESTDE